MHPLSDTRKFTPHDIAGGALRLPPLRTCQRKANIKLYGDIVKSSDGAPIPPIPQHLTISPQFNNIRTVIGYVRYKLGPKPHGTRPACLTLSEGAYGTTNKEKGTVVLHNA